MSSISEGAPVLTVINVFSVAPERQSALVELLERATREVVRHQPGFVSANLHVGLDGDRVANYAQWASVVRPAQMPGRMCTEATRYRAGATSASASAAAGCSRQAGSASILA